METSSTIINDKIILASGSPRRQQLLGMLGLDYEVRVKKGIDERYPKELKPEEVPQYLSRLKASAYTVRPGEVLLTADTVVVIDGTILGKPADEADARRMLHQLSGRTHHVVTGVTLTNTQGQRSFSVVTDVTFRPLLDSEIDEYVERCHPLDKAGAYGIQEWIGCIGVTGINGSFYNVMGLPLQRIYQELMEMYRR